MSLLELATRRVGVIRASRVLAFMLAWQVATEAVGHLLGEGEGITASVMEYASWWRTPRRTAWRELARFRECFPGELTPDRLLALAAATWEARQGARALGDVRLAGVRFS